MPYLKIQTNQSVNAEQRQPLLAKASQLVSEQLGKPQRYVMVALEDATPMMFDESTGPVAYLELKSIGLHESDTKQFSEALCGLIEQELAIPKDRIYIEFANAARHMWGWNGSTF